MRYKAYLFDLNGTMVDDMDYHIHAWHRILNELGADISLEGTAEECYGKNAELLERIFPNRFKQEEKDRISHEKEMEYRKSFKPRLKLLAGLGDFLAQAKDEGIKLAIGTAAIRSNIDFVIDGLNIRSLFDVLISADDVKHSKPDPETFLLCATQLHLNAADCLVFEDSGKGIESAQRANMDALALTTMQNASHFHQYPNVIGCIPDFTEVPLR